MKIRIYQTTIDGENSGFDAAQDAAYNDYAVHHSGSDLELIYCESAVELVESIGADIVSGLLATLIIALVYPLKFSDLDDGQLAEFSEIVAKCDVLLIEVGRPQLKGKPSKKEQS